MSTLPLPSTRAHLDALTATGGTGCLVLSTPMPEARRPGKSTPWASWTFATDEVDAAAQAAADLDAQGRNVYIRTNLLRDPLPADRCGWSWKRGTGDQTGAVVALAVDLDVAGPEHRNGNAEHPLPPTLEEALSVVAGLPDPTLTIYTGGGLHLWWVLDEPEQDAPVALLEHWADRIVEAGAVKGWHVDPPDPARVLRVCGTHRRKPGIAPNLVTLEDVAGWPADGMAVRPWCPAGRYGARELLEALPVPAPPAPPRAPTRPRRPGEVGPADAVARLTWSQILEPLRWTFAGMGTMDGTAVELWTRPGSTSDYSIKCVPDGPAVAWSDACGLPTGKGRRLNKWRVYIALHHAGDAAEAGRSIRLRSREVAR